MKGILLIGHGSRYRYNEDVLNLQADRLRKKGHENVYVGYNETSKPSIMEAMENLSKDGVDKLTVLPFFIASGIHIEKEIPYKIGLEEGQRKGIVNVSGRDIEVVFETPFGKDPALARALHRKLSAYLGNDKKSGFVVIGHGSRMGYNKEAVEHQVLELEGMGIENVHSAFNEFNEPSIEDTMLALANKGVEEITVLPLFMSLGDHLKNDVPTKIGLMDGIFEGKATFSGKEINVRYLGPVGEDPLLTDVLVEKIKRNA